MRLVDLAPRWVTDNVFVFECPHCRGILLSVKSVTMAMRDQHHLFSNDPLTKGKVVPCDVDTCWAITGRDFSSITIRPSLDASKSGHWHGHITNGEIR